MSKYHALLPQHDTFIAGQSIEYGRNVSEIRTSQKKSIMPWTALEVTGRPTFWHGRWVLR